MDNKFPQRIATPITDLSGTYPAWDRIAMVDRKRLCFLHNRIREWCGGERFDDLFLLDCGCGDGGFTAPLCNQGMKVCGFDLNGPALKRGIDHSGSDDRLLLFRGDVYDTGQMFKENSFDIAVCSEILEHIHKPDVFLKMLYRKVKAGGLLLCFVPNGAGPSEWAQAVRTAFRWWPQTLVRAAAGIFGLQGPLQCRRGRELYPEGGHVKYYGLEQWTSLLVKCGWRVRKYSTSIGWPGLAGFLLRNDGISEKNCRQIDQQNSSRACGYFLSCAKV